MYAYLNVRPGCLAKGTISKFTIVLEFPTPDSNSLDRRQKKILIRDSSRVQIDIVLSYLYFPSCGVIRTHLAPQKYT